MVSTLWQDSTTLNVNGVIHLAQQYEVFIVRSSVGDNFLSASLETR